MRPVSACVAVGPARGGHNRPAPSPQARASAPACEARLSSSDFGPALEEFLGTSHGLSAATITRLTRDWQDEAAAFNQR
jgi:hypothetical protein